MIGNFISGIKKVTLNKQKKMLAGNQLYVKEKQAIVLVSSLILIPIFIVAVTYWTHLVSIRLQ